MIAQIAKIVGIALPSLFFSTAAFAASCIQIDAEFYEGAPRDRFIIKNNSSDKYSIESATLTLRGSKGRLIFDTIDGGKGVEVFQQFRSEESSAMLATKPTLKDGADTLALTFTHFDPNETYRFSLDVDDQLTNSELGQIRVSSSEMNGAQIHYVVTDMSGKKHMISAVFGNNNSAKLKSTCI